MSVVAMPIITSKYAENVQTTQYTASSCRTIIDKFTGTNVSAINATLSVNLVANTGTASSSNLITNTRTIAPGETYTFPELSGHSLEPGGYISTIASASSSIVIRASGREIT